MLRWFGMTPPMELPDAPPSMRNIISGDDVAVSCSGASNRVVGCAVADLHAIICVPYVGRSALIRPNVISSNEVPRAGPSDINSVLVPGNDVTCAGDASADHV